MSLRSSNTGIGFAFPSLCVPDLLIDDCRDGQTVEAVGERLPQLDVVATLAFIVESVDSIDGCAFMVAAEQEEILWVFDLVRQQQTDGLQRLLTPIHIVAQEQVVGIRRESAVLEQSEQIIVLSMNVSHDFDGRLQFEQDGLRDENLARLEAQTADLTFGQVHSLAGTLATNLEDTQRRTEHGESARRSRRQFRAGC